MHNKNIEHFFVKYYLFYYKALNHIFNKRANIWPSFSLEYFLDISNEKNILKTNSASFLSRNAHLKERQACNILKRL